LQFRLLLKWLKDRYGIGEFDSGRVASALDLKKKLVSNDLRRLYRMGFLKRKRVKRSCIGRRGFISRGFQYMYSFSRHGLSYVEWLEKGKVVEDFAVADLRSDAMLRLPDDAKNRVSAAQMIEGMKPYRGPGSMYKSFPSDLLLIAYVNDSYDRLLARFRETAKESIKSSLALAKSNSENATLHFENELTNIFNQDFEKKFDSLKKEAIDSLLTSFKGHVKDTQTVREMLRRGGQVIDDHQNLRDQVGRLATMLYLYFPPNQVDEFIKHVFGKTSRKPTYIQKEAQPSTSQNPSTAAKPQEPSKIKTRVEEID